MVRSKISNSLRVDVKGLDEFRRELRKLDDRAFQKDLRRLHKKIGDFVADRAKAAASPRAKPGIKGAGTQRAALVRLTPGRRGDALAVMAGQRRRSGWYAKRRYGPSEGRQFRQWIGNQWDPGDLGGAPYEVGPAINRSLDEVVDMLGDGIEDLARRAFPS